MVSRYIVSIPRNDRQDDLFRPPLNQIISLSQGQVQRATKSIRRETRRRAAAALCMTT